MKLKDAFTGFWLDKQLDFSTTTVENYSIAFAQFGAFVGELDVEDVTTNDVRRWLGHLYTERDLTKRSIHSKWTILSSFFSWAEKELGNEHPIRGRVSAPEYSERTIEPFTEKELRKLVRATTKTSSWVARNGERVQSLRPTALRDKAIILTLADTGLRASELAGLTLDDYDADRGRMYVRHGKGDKARIVVVGNRTRKAIWRYQSSVDVQATGPLFATKDGHRIRRDNLYHMVKRLGDKAGVANVHPHRFRHTFAIEFLRNGGQILVLKELLGHEELDMVTTYARIAEQDLDNSVLASPADNWRL